MIAHDRSPAYSCPRDDYYPGNPLWFGWINGNDRVAGMDLLEEENEIFIVSRILSAEISSRQKKESLILLARGLSSFTNN